ncbi:MAG: hypothetical protein J5871_03500 [Bacteroidales bacterium]|nr:hypothetical protein [Bacteroidales bacterium]
MRIRILLATCLLPFLFAACTKQWEPEGSNSSKLPMMADGTYKLTMNPQAEQMETAEGEDTKTAISGSNIIWSTGESVKLYYGSTGTAGNAYTWVNSDEEVLLSSGNQKATFYFYLAAAPTGKMGACYPASQCAADANGINMTLPAAQTATASSYDVRSMLLTATPTTTFTTPWNCTFNRRVATNKINITNLGSSKVYSVKITSNSANLAGTKRFNPTTGADTGTFTSGGTKTITVTYSGGVTPSGGTLNVYFNSWEAASGTTLTVRINFNATDGVSYKEGVITLASGVQVNKLNNFSISANNLGLRPSLVDFAKEFVGILDIWSNTIGFVDADSSHMFDTDATSAMSTGWAGVHYVPIPRPEGNTYTKMPNQYSATGWSMTVGGTTYTAAQAWVIAAKGLLDMMTSQTSSVTNSWATGTSAWSNNITFTNKNTIHKTAIPNTTIQLQKGNLDITVFGANPWYEKDTDGEIGVFGSSSISAGNVLLLLQFWLYRMADRYETVTNFRSSDEVTGVAGYGGMTGYISAMRMMLVMARIYKYILDNQITANTWTALSGQTFSADLYGFSSGLKVCQPGTIAAFAGNFGRLYTFRDGGGTIPTDAGNYSLIVKANHIATGGGSAGASYTTTKAYDLAIKAYKAMCVSGTWSNTGGMGNNGAFTASLPDVATKTLPGSPQLESTALSPTNLTLAALNFLNYVSYNWVYNSSNTAWPNYCGSINGYTLGGTKYSGAACFNRELIANTNFYKQLYEAYTTTSWNGTNVYSKMSGATILANYKN